MIRTELAPSTAVVRVPTLAVLNALGGPVGAAAHILAARIVTAGESMPS